MFGKYKIQSYSQSIASLPDKIQGKAAWLKKQFDARTAHEVKDMHNALCDELENLQLEQHQQNADGHIRDEIRHITAAERTLWNDRYTRAETDRMEKALSDAQKAHDGDAVRHLTAAERTLWNDRYTRAELDAKEQALKKAHTQHETDTVRHITGEERARWNAMSQSPPGSGDMQKEIYDADYDGVVDDAQRLGGRLPEYYAAQSSVRVFEVTFPASGWQKEKENWVQAVACKGMKADCDCEPPWMYLPEGAASKEQCEDFAKLLKGSMQTLDEQVRACVAEKPQGDVTICMRAARPGSIAPDVPGESSGQSATKEDIDTAFGELGM